MTVRPVLALTHRARRRRLHALLSEIQTLRQVCAVAMRDRADAQAMLAEASQDHRNGVRLDRYVSVCQQLHVAEDEIRHLKEAAHARR